MKTHFACFEWKSDDSLFSVKDQYLTSHDDKGKVIALGKLSTSKQRRLRIDNMQIAVSLPFASDSHYPIVKPYSGSIDLQYVSYTERKKHSGEGCALGFFLYDSTFLNATWNKLEKTTREIIDLKYEAIFVPDYSLYLNDSLYEQNKYNIYRSRVVAAYWQTCGMNVIPVATWGNANSFSYCFDGLPMNSVIAVSGTSHGNKQSHILWCCAIRELVRLKQPTTIIVYGGKVCEVEGVDTPLLFIDGFINRRFRK